jgi:hypothetical protein
MISDQQLYYLAWKLSHKKSISDDTKYTGVLSEAKVDLNPHQVEAALFAFKSPLSKGAIMADEVGLGKTIEAGIILSQLWAEHKRRIIIVVPASLRTQWSEEMLDKFYLPSIIVERTIYDKFKYRGEDIFNQQSLVIVSYNFAQRYSKELSKINWDLVVLDEAHKLRNVFKKTKMAQTIKDVFKNNKKILLTATPLQNNLKELYGLVSIIDDNFFFDADNFNNQYNSVTTRDSAKFGELKNRIGKIVHRTLRKHVQEYVNYTKRIPMLQEFVPSDKELKLYNGMNDYLLRDDTYGIPLKYKPLLTLLLRKIMASSSYALGFTIGNIISRLENENYEDSDSFAIDISSDYDRLDDENRYLDLNNKEELDSSDLSQEIKELKELQSIAFSIEEDTKVKRLLDALSLGFAKMERIGANKKALIFTESRKTQEYLYHYLNENGFKGEVVTYNGTNNDEASKGICKAWIEKHKGLDIIKQSAAGNRKQAIIDYFKNEASILVSTEAGAEGINLQFCSLLINYDMPWNPQRVEQRIGRCHRYGQKFDVVVVNFVNKTNQAEQRIYELLDEKFNLFSDVFGSSDEILGSLESGVDFEKRLLKIYQNCRTSLEIESAFEELRIELESTINERIKQTKKSLLENFDEDVIEKLRIRQSGDIKRVTNYQRHFWTLSKAMLNSSISNIDDKNCSFKLIKAPTDEILTGEYILNKEFGNKHQLRLSHPLGEYLIDKALSLKPNDQFLSFYINTSPYKQTLIENYVGKQGYTIGYLIQSSNENDNEEQLIMCSQTSDGEILPDEFAEKLFELNSISKEYVFPSSITRSIEKQFTESLDDYKNRLQDKVDAFVNLELEKYEDWEKDHLVPAENEIISLRREFDIIKRKIRKEPTSVNKIELREQERLLNKQIKQKQNTYFKLQDEYDELVEEMISKLRKSMDNKFDISMIFKFSWELV